MNFFFWYAIQVSTARFLSCVTASESRQQQYQRNGKIETIAATERKQTRTYTVSSMPIQPGCSSLRSGDRSDSSRLYI